MGASLYEPINVYKSVAPNMGIVDGPFEHFIVAGVKLPLPFTTRMTVVRLASGDLFLHSLFKEFIFFQKASKTLILTDTIINIERDNVTEPCERPQSSPGCIIPMVRYSSPIR